MRSSNARRAARVFNATWYVPNLGGPSSRECAERARAALGGANCCAAVRGRADRDRLRRERGMDRNVRWHHCPEQCSDDDCTQLSERAPHSLSVAHGSASNKPLPSSTHCNYSPPPEGLWA